MKNLTYSFLIITIILIDCNYSIAQKNEALSRSSFNIADNKEIAIDSIVKELKNEYILQLPDKDNFNSAVLRAFEQDNIGIVDLQKYINYVLKHRKFSYWSIRPDINFFSSRYIGYKEPEKGGNRISDVTYSLGNQNKDNFVSFYRKLFQSKAARDVLTKYLTSYLVDLCKKYPCDFKKSILYELQNLIEFTTMLPILENIDTDKLNGYWQGFIYRRYTTDNVPLDEILNKLNSLHSVLSNSQTNNSISKIVEIRINNQFSLFYSATNILISSGSKSIYLDEIIQINKLKYLKDNEGEYYILNGFKGEQPFMYMFDKNLNEILKETDDVISGYYKSNRGDIHLLKSPDLNSEIVYSLSANDAVGIINESIENYFFFFVKTKSGNYGYLPKSSFNERIISKYSSSEYANNFIKDTLLINANNLYSKQDFEKAYTIVEHIKTNYPNALYLKGLLEMNYKNNYSEAKSNFCQYYKINKNNHVALLIGHLSEILNEQDEAIKYYSDIINNDNTFIEAYFRRGVVLSEIEKRNEAIKDYDYIISSTQLNEQNLSFMATVYNNKAYALIKLNKIEEAKPLVEKALDLEQNLPFIWDTSGELNYHMGNFKKCIEDMNKAISLSESANSYYYRGLAKIKLNIKESGCIDLSKSAELGNLDAFEDIKKQCN